MKITNKKQSQQEINEQQAFQNLSQVRDRVNQNETVSSIFNRVYLPSGATFLFLTIVLNLIIGGLDKGNTSLSLGCFLSFLGDSSIISPIAHGKHKTKEFS